MLNLNICSPCNNVRGEAHHKRADECADLLSGPQPPPPLLIQAFLPHTVEVHTGAIICPGGRMGDPHASWNGPHTNLLEPSGTDCVLSCGNINYGYVCILRMENWLEQTTNDWNHTGCLPDAEHARKAWITVWHQTCLDVHRNLSIL